MAMRKTKRLSSDATAQAADLLCAGDLVAFPTETVYGLGADARNAKAVAKIFEAKNRPSFNPLIVHVADLAAAQELAEFSGLALNLAKRFWPGPLTLTLPLRKKHPLCDLVSAGLPSIAVRIPSHPLAQNLLQAAAIPIAAPSANLSTTVSPTSAAHVLKTLDGRIDAVLDGGPTTVGLESTILSVIGQQVTLLRLGGLDLSLIEDVINQKLNQDLSPEQPSAPGQMLKHYATRARLSMNCKTPVEGAIMIGFGSVEGDLTLSKTGDLIEAAANLFEMLHKADSLAGPDGQIAVAPIPDQGLGLAINDRLKRAAS